MDKMEKTTFRLGLYGAIFILAMILYGSFSSAWSNSTFNNSLSAENITFSSIYSVTDRFQNDTSYAGNGGILIYKNGWGAGVNKSISGYIDRIYLRGVRLGSPDGYMNISIRNASNYSQIFATKKVNANITTTTGTELEADFPEGTYINGRVFILAEMYGNTNGILNTNQITVTRADKGGASDNGIFEGENMVGLNELNGTNPSLSTWASESAVFRIVYKTNMKNTTRYISVPTSTTVITNARMNLTGKLFNDGVADFVQQEATGGFDYWGAKDNTRLGMKKFVCGNVSSLGFWVGRYNSTGVLPSGNWNITIRRVSDDSVILTKDMGAVSSLPQDVYAGTYYQANFTSNFICEDVWLSREFPNNDNYTFRAMYPNTGSEQTFVYFSGGRYWINYSSPYAIYHTYTYSRKVGWTDDCYGDGDNYGCWGNGGKLATYNLTYGTLGAYPTNITIKIGGANIYSYTGTFNQNNNRTNNFANTLSNMLTSTYISGSNYLIPIIFNSVFEGNLQYSDMTFNNEGFLENNQTYVSSALGGSVQTFSLNMTYDSSYYTGITGYLVYNGVQYLATKTGSGNTVMFTRDLTTPSTAGNYTFYWSIGLSASPYVYYNSTSHNQTIANFTLDNCSVGTVPLYNFTLRDEATRQILNGTSNNTMIDVDLTLSTYGTTDSVLTYNAQYSQVNPARICLDKNLTNERYRIDMVVDYVTDGRVKEFYYIDNGTIVNSSKNMNIDLHDLLLTDSTTFLFEWTDETGLAVPDSIVHVFRKYIGEGVFREVERAKQDDNGQTHIHVVEEDVIYYFQVSLNNQTLWTSSTYNAKCLSSPCKIVLSASGELNPLPDDWDLENDIDYLLSQNKTSRLVSLTFASNVSHLANLSLYRIDSNGAVTLIDTTSLQGLGGILSLNVPASYGNQTFFASIFFDNEFIRSEWIDFRINARDIFGVFGAILSGLVVLAIILMAVSEGVGLIVFTVLGLLVSGLLMLVDLSWVAFISLACAGGIIIWKLIQRRNSFNG